MDNMIEKLAAMITEDVNDTRIPQTPSQVFSQVIMHGFDRSKPLQAALQSVKEYGALMKLDPMLVQQALEYTQIKYKPGRIQ